MRRLVLFVNPKETDFWKGLAGAEINSISTPEGAADFIRKNLTRILAVFSNEKSILEKEIVKRNIGINEVRIFETGDSDVKDIVSSLLEEENKIEDE